VVRGNDDINQPIPEDLAGTGYVTMLRLLVSPGSDMPVADAASLREDSLFFTVLKQDLKRAKWIDDETMELGLVRHPSIGVEKAEVITALCSMLHGPLSKVNNGLFSSVRTIISTLDSSPHFINSADAIAELFLDRFRPANLGGVELSEEAFQQRAADIHTKVSRLHNEGLFVGLSACLVYFRFYFYFIIIP
jgi:hypothetical protein